MAKWFFEPGHTAAEFSVRHMMVTFVRGHFKDIHGTLVFDPAPSSGCVSVRVPALRVRDRDPAHRLRQLTVGTWPQKQMPRHQTICCDAYIRALVGFGENFFKRGIIRTKHRSGVRSLLLLLLSESRYLRVL